MILAADSYTVLLNEIAVVSKQFHVFVDAGFLIFSRMLGLMLVAPVLGRKDVPFNIKVSFAMILSVVLLWTIPIPKEISHSMLSDNVLLYCLQIGINVTIGLFIGFIAATIMEAINAAGSLMNNQIGLSSAMMFDPGSRQQVALMERFMGYIALIVFFQIGGMYWLITALIRSFEVFPLVSVRPDLVGQVSLDYVVQVTGNTFSVGLYLIAPVMLVTMAVDLILGIVNRAAQQIQVFQLSFALKPCIGLGAFLVTLPVLIRLLENYLNDYSRIF